MTFNYNIVMKVIRSIVSNLNSKFLNCITIPNLVTIESRLIVSLNSAIMDNDNA